MFSIFFIIIILTVSKHNSIFYWHKTNQNKNTENYAKTDTNKEQTVNIFDYTDGLYNSLYIISKSFYKAS